MVNTINDSADNSRITKQSDFLINRRKILHEFSNKKKDKADSIEDIINRRKAANIIRSGFELNPDNFDLFSFSSNSSADDDPNSIYFSWNSENKYDEVGEYFGSTVSSFASSNVIRGEFIQTNYYQEKTNIDSNIALRISGNLNRPKIISVVTSNDLVNWNQHVTNVTLNYDSNDFAYIKLYDDSGKIPDFKFVRVIVQQIENPQNIENPVLNI